MYILYIVFIHFFLVQHESQIFPPTTGGAIKMASDMGVTFLGSLPLDPRIGWCCDQGRCFLTTVSDSPAAIAYLDIIQSESVSGNISSFPPS